MVKRRSYKTLTLAVLFCFWLSHAGIETPAHAIPNSSASSLSSVDSARRYRTPEERREAGVRHEVNEWIELIGLVELEYERKRNSLGGKQSHSYFDEDSGSVQAAAELEPVEWFTAELVYEYELDTGKDYFEEAIGALEFANFGIEFGIMEVPFGEYYSYFVTGPLVEFGETTDSAVLFSYKHSTVFEISSFFFDGRAVRDGPGEDLDWGLAFEAQPGSGLQFGLSFLSNLANTDQQLLEETRYRYSRKVPGVSSFFTISREPYDLSLEYVGALRSFKELESEFNQPQALNLELSRAMSDELAVAARVEWSKELEGEAGLRSGISLAWRVHERIILTLDLLRAWFRDEHGYDHNDHEIRSSNTVAIQLGVGL